MHKSKGITRLANPLYSRITTQPTLCIHKRYKSSSTIDGEHESTFKQKNLTETEQKESKRLPDAPILIDKLGIDLINSALYNKGTGYPHAERDRLRIRGLVPPRCMSMEDQIERIMKRYRSINDDISKNAFLTSLQDRNETLFYRILIDNVKEMTRIIYTPTVGKAAINFGHLYRKTRGMYFSTDDRGQMASMVYNWPEKKVDVIVVTDGSRILGLGDLGVHGMAIPIGKLALYVAGAGIHPKHVLPVTIDAGTNNPKLLKDPLYLGLQHNRITGAEYYTLIDEFIFAVRQRWPDALIQFEDFENANALPLLQKYRHSQLCFNDDIQGTGAVALSGLLCALRARDGSIDNFAKERIVCVGAGSAGLGVVKSLVMGMVKGGATEEEAHRNFWLVDKDGLLGINRETLANAQIPFARPEADTYPDKLSLLDTVKAVKPTILLGLSGVGGIFTEPVIREMSKHVERPIIFPMSNPDTSSECTAENAFEWTNGRALVATGTPFSPVVINGNTKIACQANNMFIFPGVGLGALLSKTPIITDSMFYEAAKALANKVSDKELKEGRVYPDISDIRNVSVSVAMAVINTAFNEGLATIKRPEDLEEFVRSNMYDPKYVPLIYPNGHGH
eukprot:TRINITY_DN9090_c0_g1_i1.p1 TRINITY_DN9090_c0_g1~~TRINITY_DN9090_c0_g1_i1.p1  ORF type:complete len:641 (-),score=126.13 TRINITY_DN9090_c0_g1_i1:192-2054(-)